MNSCFSKTIQLNKVQQSIIDGEPNVIVKGLAGTGKTMTVVHLAKKLAEHSTVGIVIWTLSLKKFLAESIDSDNVKVLTSKSKLYVFDYLIIDEVQDFSLIEINRLSKYSKNGIYFFGDDNQQLGRERKNATIEQIRATTNFPVVELIENIRLSKPIDNFLSKYLAAKKPIDDAVLNNAQEATWKQIINLGTLIRQIISVFKGTTAIICNQNLEVDEYRVYLQEHGYRNVGYKTDSDEQLNFEDTDTINVLTFHAAKGLEFANVIILNGERKGKEYLYVGISRATKNAIILLTNFDGSFLPCPITREYSGFFIGDPVKYWEVNYCNLRPL